MLYILYFYLIFICFFLFYFSKKGTLYIFSPFIPIYLAFAVNDVIPLIAAQEIGLIDIPSNLKHVTALTAIINIGLLLCHRKQMTNKVEINVPVTLNRYNQKRKYLFLFFCFLMCFAGLITGITPALLRGADVENMRMTTDIGMGFIRAIPTFAIPFMLLIYLFQDTAKGFWAKGFICLSVGFIFFLTTAARGGLLIFAVTFFIWFNITKRGFKWYEYCGIYYVLSPVIAALLFILRGGGLRNEDVSEFTLFSHQLMIFGANTLKLMNLWTDKMILWGESYYYELVKIIPRFIWPNKPVSIDYKYKEMVGMEFDGGGIYTTIPNDFYLNFGYYHFIPYIIWALILHYLYKKLCQHSTSFHTKILFVSYLALYSHPKALIANTEIYILFLFLCFFIYKRWKAI